MNTRYDYEINSQELKVPPNSMQAEQAVLGSLMMDNKTWDSVADLIIESDFYRPNHKLIFRMIEKLANEQMPFDLVTLSEELKKVRELDRIGGVPYLNLLIENTPTAANIVAYAKILKDKSHLRDLIQIGTEIVESAFDGKTEYAESKLSIFSPKEEQPEAQEWVSDLSADIDFIIPAHFGIAADIQRWILDTSVKKQPVLAFSATLAIMGAVVGRHINCDGIKGNFMSICIAESTEGKDHPLKCVKEILDAIGLEHNHKGAVNSGVAIMDILEHQPNTVLVLDEIGHFLAGVKSPNSTQYTKEVMPMITELYTSANKSYQEKAKKGSGGRVIKEPNLCVFGVATERQIMDGLRTSELADGSLGRFGVFFGNKNVRINENSIDMDDKSCPSEIIEKLIELKNSVGNNDFTAFMKSSKLELSNEYKALKKRLIIDFNDKGIELALKGGNRAIFKPFYGRLAVQAVQVSLLINQCANAEVLQWSADLLERNVEIFIKKFIHGAADNESERQFKMVERAIKEAGKKGITAKDLSSTTRQVIAHQKKAIIAELLDVGKVFTKDVYLNGSRKATTVYYWRK